MLLVNWFSHKVCECVLMYNFLNGVFDLETYLTLKNLKVVNTFTHFYHSSIYYGNMFVSSVHFFLNLCLQVNILYPAFVFYCLLIVQEPCLELGYSVPC